MFGGFILEKVGAEGYITYFARPTADHVAPGSMTFGDYLPKPRNRIPLSTVYTDESAHEFVRRMESHWELATSLQSPGSLVKLMESREVLHNPPYRWTYTLALILAGRLDEAQRQLNLLAAALSEPGDQRLGGRAIELRAALRRGAGATDALLISWEKETRAAYGLEGGEVGGS